MKCEECKKGEAGLWSCHYCGKLLCDECAAVSTCCSKCAGLED